MNGPGELRFITYLAPAIPREFFQGIVDHIGARTGVEVSLRAESRVSGPEPDDEDPFSRNEADLGWICSPSYIWLRRRKRPAVELLPAAPVFRDRRNRGRPAFFSEVIVRRRSPIRSFRALEGSRWVYNDACSLSGYYSVFHKLAEIRSGGRFFREMRPSGSHLKSIELVIDGRTDAAAIDSNVLALLFAKRPELRSKIRVIESWGPFPIQPMVGRSGLPPSLIETVTEALLEMHTGAPRRRVLERHRVSRFVPVSDDEYQGERRALRACRTLVRSHALAEAGQGASGVARDRVDSPAASPEG